MSTKAVSNVESIFNIQFRLTLPRELDYLYDYSYSMNKHVGLNLNDIYFIYIYLFLVVRYS